MNAGFNLSAKKCKFCVDSVFVLGHHFGQGKFRPNDKRLKTLTPLCIPKDLQSL